MGNTTTHEKEQVCESDGFDLTRKMLFTSKLSDTYYQEMKLNDIKLKTRDIPRHVIDDIVANDNIEQLKKIENLMENKSEIMKIILNDTLVVSGAKKIMSHLNTQFDSSNIPLYLLDCNGNSGCYILPIFERCNNKKEFLELKYKNRKILHIYLENQYMPPQFVKYVDLTEKYTPRRLIGMSDCMTIAHVSFYDARFDTIKEIFDCDKKVIFIPNSDGYTPFDLYLMRCCVSIYNIIIKSDDIIKVLDLFDKSDLMTLFNNKTKINKLCTKNDFDPSETLIPKGSTFLDIIECYDSRNIHRKNVDAINTIRNKITKIMETKN